MGSSPLTKQKTYQLISENVFTGSTYNPVNDLKIQNILRHSTTATDFHGFSKFITARSVLASDDLAAEPFVTYFNLGNGTFFNVKGETTFKMNGTILVCRIIYLHGDGGLLPILWEEM